MILKKIALIATIIFFTNKIYAQNQGLSNVWLTGYYGGFGETKLDFNNGSPIITQYNIPMDFRHTHANISDTTGNLLFYTNGYYIADAGNDTMLNGSGLTPGAFANYAPDGFTIPQGALILPSPGNSNLYYLFHCTVDNFPPVIGAYSYHLYKTTIDMSLGGGLGAVTMKNQAILNDTLMPGKIVACRHANGVDWWILFLRANSNKIYKLLLTSTGITVTSQNIGIYRTWFTGQAKFSSDGKRFAFLDPEYSTNGSFEIFDFDRCTGTLSNDVQINIQQSSGFNCGLEFSPNSNVLYVCNLDTIYQYDVTSPNIAATQTVVAAWDGFYQPGIPNLWVSLGQPQLAPDGKIYFTSGNGTTYFGTIDNPDVLGLGCNVAQHSVVLPTYNYNTIPNHPNFFLGCDTTGGCICLVGTNEIEKGKIIVHAAPNPNNGIFTLQFPVQKTNGELEVYDLMGNLAHKEYIGAWSQYKKIDITTLPSGIYLCKMKWETFEGGVKVVKE